MEDYTTTTDPTQQLNGLLGGTSGEPLIPESLSALLIIGFVIINLLTIAFLIFWFAGMVRRWKVQTAVLHMQKDIAEIKESLAKPTASAPIFIEPTAKEEPVKAETPAAATNTDSQNSENI